MASGRDPVAAESLEKLQKLEPSLTTLAQLVTAYDKFDLGKALAASKLLPPFQPLGTNDVDRWEALPAFLSLTVPLFLSPSLSPSPP